MKLRLNDLQSSCLVSFRESARRYVQATEKQEAARKALAAATKEANAAHDDMETAFAVFDAQMDDPPRAAVAAE